MDPVQVFHVLVSLLLQPPAGRMRCPTVLNSNQQHILLTIFGALGSTKIFAEQLEMPSHRYQLIGTLVL